MGLALEGSNERVKQIRVALQRSQQLLIGQLLLPARRADLGDMLRNSGLQLGPGFPHPGGDSGPNPPPR
jgi:hypothetical protein